MCWASLMQNRQITHFVALRDQLTDRETALLAKFAKLVESDSDRSLLGFECVSVDASGHSYIEIETIWDSRQSIVKLRLPSYLVLAIFEIRPDQKSPIGFC